jgi:hypothetical protein
VKQVAPHPVSTIVLVLAKKNVGGLAQNHAVMVAQDHAVMLAQDHAVMLAQDVAICVIVVVRMVVLPVAVHAKVANIHVLEIVHRIA